MSLLFNMLSSLVITFFPRSKHLLISCLQSPSAVILVSKKIKSVNVSPSICHEVMGPDAMILVFWTLSFKPIFSLSSFTFIKRLFSYSSFSAKRLLSSAYLRLLLFLLATLIPACASSSPAFLMMEKTPESPLDCKEIQPVHSKGNQPWVFFGRNDAKAETPVLWIPHAKNWLIGKDSDAGRDWGQDEKVMTEDEMAGWHHRFDGPELEWTPLVGDGQGDLTCCDSWGRKESATIERLKWTELNWTLHIIYIAEWQYTALMYFFPYLEPVCCSMSRSNCCFLTSIQIFQEAGQVVWYSHL